MGANLKVDFRSVQFVAGDQLLQIVSPIYGDQYRGFYTRGLSTNVRLGKRTSLLLFGGATGYTSGSRLFELVRPDQIIGSVQLEYQPNEKVSIFTRSVFSSRQSVISGFDYHPGRRFTLGAQGGIGSNTPYAAFTGAYKDDASTVEMSYVASKPEFRLVQVNTLNYQEPINENIHVHHKFDGLLQFDYRRSNFQFTSLNGTLSQFSGNSIFINGRLKKTGWNAGYNHVVGDQFLKGTQTTRDAQQVNFGLNQSIGRFRINALHYRPVAQSAGDATRRTFTTVMLQEPLGRWMMLRQIMNRSNNWGVSYGGEVHNNYFNFSLDYQTAFNVFQSGPTQFTQGAIVEGDLNLPGGTKLFVNTNVTPDGRFLYSWGLRTSFTGPFGRGASATANMADVDAPQIPRFLVRGKVLEAATGLPVANVPVVVGNETIFTDENGAFGLHLFSGREIAAGPDTSTPHMGFQYQLSEGPKRVRPVKNGLGEVYIWKVKKGSAISESQGKGLIISSQVEPKSPPLSETAQRPSSNP